ncbi:hypothetical protein D3C74_483300 [compost metagenome]
MENDDLIDPVEEFGTEAFLQLIHHFALHVVVIRTGILHGGEAKTRISFDGFGADI